MRGSSIVASRLSFTWPCRQECGEENIYNRFIYDKCKLFLDQTPSWSGQFLVAVEDYPLGWPRLAAFLNSDDNFTIFRKFGQSHCRVLVQLQAEITALEQDLLELDRSDSREGSGTLYRLKRVNYLQGEDMVQKDKLEQLRKKLIDYGKACFENP